MDLEEEINEFLKNGFHIYDMHYQVAMTYSNELEYSFSCMILYDSFKQLESSENRT